VALEEVVKYADTVNYLARSFGIADRLKCLPKTLYDALPLFADYFDYIVYSGVIYHVTDPLLSLRLIFSALKDGGKAFIETYGFASAESSCRYEGPSIVHSGTRAELNRGGWNYFIPSSRCLEAWCEDAGFQAARSAPVHDRLLAVAERSAFQDICRAGLSRASVR
jgi:SAM-dependent methyltransferase